MAVNILLISGSIRTGSLSTKLATVAARSPVMSDLKAELLSLADYDMPLFNGDLEKTDGQPDAARELAGRFSASDGIVIVSPEYNAGITPLLKNTLDWISRVRDPDLSPFKNPVFAIGSASPGGFGGLRALMMLRQALQLGLGALVIPEQIILPRAGSAFTDDGNLADDATAARLDAMLTALLARIPAT